ncbi:MAG: hypothetical protein LBP61_04480 [Desulfovibrio sp.]|jgi:hypothetical protein|nr:hypothetical protein [Desulfovibrio sp.]
MFKISIRDALLFLNLALLFHVTCITSYAAEAPVLDITAVSRVGGLAYVSNLDDINFTDVETGKRLKYTKLYFEYDGIRSPVTGVEFIREGNGVARFISEARVDDKVVGRARRVYGRVPGGTKKIIFRSKYKLEGDELTII